MVAIRPTDLHRVYIQSLLSRRAMREEVALELYKRAIGICQSQDEGFLPAHPGDIRGLSQFLEDISTLLEEVGMTIKRGREETAKGKTWIALINTDPNDVAKSATDYNPLEISYYREIVAAIITSYPANSIGTIAALSLASKLKTIVSKTQAEVILVSMVSRGWLAKSKRGRYSLGPRAMMELETYLKGEFEDYYQVCGKCSKHVLSGIACTYEGCDTHLHPYCYAPLLLRPPASCPTCKKSYDDYPPKDVGEKAVAEREDHWNTLKNKRKRPSGRGGNQNEEEEEEEIGDEDEEVEDQSTNTPASTTQPRPNRRRSKNTRSESRIPETQLDSD